MKTWEATAREHLRAILASALDALAPQSFMREGVSLVEGRLHVDGSSVDLHRPGGVVRLAAVGKAARGMAAQAAPWGPFEEALVVAPRAGGALCADAGAPEGFEVIESDHPLPSEASVRAGERLLALARATGPEDTLLLLVSGGASALVEVPEVPLEDLCETTDLLLRSAVDIRGVNAVRKHLSGIKGGRLVAATRGRIVALYLSDVVEDDVSVIASGLAAPDPTTYAEAARVLEAAGVWEAAPASVRERIAAGVAKRLPETPKPGLPLFGRVTHSVLAGNAHALRRGHDTAHRLGYHTLALAEGLRGEAREAGEAIAILARDALRGDLAVKPPCAILFGGETVVRVAGSGRGGRNQEVALAAVEGLSGMRAVLGTLATDGVDGPTDAAGAVVDGFTYARAREVGLDVREHLAENDAYPFFDGLHDLVRTGPTGTNVRDLAVLLVGRPEP